MKVKRNNLTDQLKDFDQSQTTPSHKSSPPIIINYDQIIEKQSLIIESLYRQCTALRQKVNRLKSQQLFSSQHKLTPQKNMDKFAQMIENALFKEIGNLLEIQENQISRNKVMQSIKRLKWQRQKKSQPIFIESKKEIRIPVPVQIVVEKLVQKIVIKQKIVIQQKIVQVPVFRQKVVQRFVSKIQQKDQLLSTVSKLSSKEQKDQNSSGLQKSDDSLFLGTQSVLKENSSQKQAKPQRKMSSTQIQQKSQFYRPQKKEYRNFGLTKNITLSDIKQDQSNINKTFYHDNKNPSSQSQFNSKGNKQYVKSPKYQKNEYRDNYNKYDYNQEDDYNNNYSKRNDYNEKGSRNDKTYYRSPYDNNKTMISPKNYQQQKYKDQTDKYTFDKNKYFDSTKINPNNKNIKRRDTYNFETRYKDR